MEEGKENKMECPECKNGACPECGHMHGYGFGHGFGCHHCWRHGGHWFIRLILLVIILAFVFSAGIKLGELKSFMYYGGSGNYSPMWRGSGQITPENGCYGPGMMYLWGKNYQTPTSTTR